MKKATIDDDKAAVDAAAIDNATVDDVAAWNDNATVDDAATVPDNEAVSQKGKAVTIAKGRVLLETYRIESDAIKGGMGRVWRVHHTGWNTDLAMKQPQAKVFQTERQKEKFINECDAWINLGLHPHIVSCYYVREIGGIPTIFSEWMDGGSLADVIRDGSLYRETRQDQQARILDIAIQLARGLHYAHEQKLIHRDVKPDNVLLTKNGEVKVADFGIAKARAELTVLDGDAANGDIPNEDRAAGTLIAAKGAYTPEYCSPEQQSGGELTRRTDIYSWAVSVLEMYLGGRRWKNGVIAGVACETYFPDSKVAISAEMQALLKECLNADQAGRPHDFALIEKALCEIYESETGGSYARPASKAAADTADSLNNRALSFLDLGKTEEAETCWEKAVAADPNHAVAAYNDSLYQWRNGTIDDEEAVARLENIVRNTDSLIALLCLAQLHLERKDFSSARPLLERIAETDGDPIMQQHALRLLTEVKEGKEEKQEKLDRKDKGDKKDKKEKPEEWTFSGHSGVFSPDNRTILSGGGRGEENNAVLLDAQTGRKLAVFQGHTAPVNCVAISPDGRYGLSGSQDKTVRLWDLKTGKCLHTLDEQRNYLQSVCFTPNGSQFLAGGYKMTLWDTATFEPVRSYYEDFRNIFSIHISEDGQQIVSGSGGGKVYIHALADRKTVREIQVAPSCWVIRAVCYAGASGHILAETGDQHKVNRLGLWQVDKSEPLHIFDGHKEQIKALCGSRDGRYALSGGVDHKVKLWDIPNRRCLRTYSEHITTVIHVAFSGNDQYALSSSEDNTTRLWQLPSFDVRADWFLSKISTTDEILKTQRRIAALLTEARRLLAAKDIAGALQTMKRMDDIPGSSAAPGYAELHTQVRKYCQTIALRSCRTAGILRGHKASVTAAAFSPDGLHAVSVSIDKAVRIWSHSSGECLHRGEHNHWVRDVCISPDGQWAISAGCDDKLILWDMASGAKLKTLEGHRGFVNAVALDPAGRLAVSGGTDKTLKVWDLKSGECLRSLTGHEDEVQDVCVSPDGKTALSCGKDGTIRRWELAGGTVLHTYNVGKPVWSVCFSPDGRTFLSGGCTGDPMLCLWDVRTNQCIRRFSGHLDIYGGYQNKVHAVCFTPDGRFAVSASREMTLRVWDIRNGQCVRALEGHGSCIYTAAFSQDGGYLLTGAEDTTCRIWQLDWEYLFPGWADWDEEARPYLEIFLTLHPDYNDSDFQQLIADLQNHGYGWLRPGGVRAELEKLKPKKKKGLFGWWKN